MKDLPFVVEIENLNFPNPWELSTFQGEMENRPISNPYVIVYKPAKRVIGYICVWLIKKEAQISNISIHPDYHRLGIGWDVMCRILRKIRKKGASFIFLEVRPSNKAAFSLYQKLGFYKLGIHKNYYKNPDEDAYIMGKNL